jgi:hypothetical protein
MIRIEASSRRELAKADLIDKNAKPYNLPTEEMERLYLCNGIQTSCTIPIVCEVRA